MQSAHPPSMTRWFLAWVGLVPLMIGNGLLREAVFTPQMSELAAHRLSTVTASLILGIYLYPVLPRIGITTNGRAWRLGLMWLALTVVFEFGFGHYVAGHSWQRLVADYDLYAGRVWPLFLLWVLVAPRVMLRISGQAVSGGQGA